MMLASLSVLIVLLFVCGIPLLIGVLVYRDAAARGMEPLLWALVAALVPSFIGLIVYLIVRSNHAAAVCARCGAPVQEGFVCCPSCGAQLQYTCPSCGRPVEDGWRLCAYCGAELPSDRPQAVRSRTGSLKGLWIVLLLIVVMVVFVAAVILLAMVSYVTIGTEVTTQTVAAAYAAA